MENRPLDQTNGFVRRWWCPSEGQANIGFEGWVDDQHDRFTVAFQSFGVDGGDVEKKRPRPGEAGLCAPFPRGKDAEVHGFKEVEVLVEHGNQDA